MPVAHNFPLVRLNLLLLLLIVDFLPLELIADQSAGTQTKTSANGSASAGMTNKRSSSCAAQRTDPCALFPGGKGAAGAAIENNQ
jgi:hypothetical protein